VEAQVEARVAHLERRAAVKHLAAEAAVAGQQHHAASAVARDGVMLAALEHGDRRVARSAKLRGELRDLGEDVGRTGEAALAPAVGSSAPPLEVSDPSSRRRPYLT
jgi:hypothetical protein